MRRSVVLLIFWVVVGLVAEAVIVASLWNLDWVIWTRDFGLYYPFPGVWGRSASDSLGGLGFWVNLQYYQIAIASVAVFVSGFVLGRFSLKLDEKCEGGDGCW